MSDAACIINFTDSTNNAMSWNSSGFYEYNRSFSSSGTFDFNVTCNRSGYSTLTANDTISITSDFNLTFIKNSTTTFTYGYKTGNLTNITLSSDNDSLVLSGSNTIGEYISQAFNFTGNNFRSCYFAALSQSSRNCSSSSGGFNQISALVGRCTGPTRARRPRSARASKASSSVKSSPR